MNRRLFSAWCLLTLIAGLGPNRIQEQTPVEFEHPVKQRLFVLTDITNDPDGDSLQYPWFVYREAGGFTGALTLHNAEEAEIRFEMPQLSGNQQLHIIPEVKDSGNPAIFTIGGSSSPNLYD